MKIVMLPLIEQCIPQIFSLNNVCHVSTFTLVKYFIVLVISSKII